MKKRKVLSIFLVGLFLASLATILAGTFFKEKYGFIIFYIGLGMLGLFVLILTIGAITSNAILKKKQKEPSYTVTAKILRIDAQSSVISKDQYGEANIKKFYMVTVEYSDNKNKKQQERLSREFSASEAQYLSSLSYVNIEVSGYGLYLSNPLPENLPEVNELKDADISVKDSTNSNPNVEIHDKLGKSTHNAYRIESIIIMVCIAPTFIFVFVILISLIIKQSYASAIFPAIILIGFIPYIAVLYNLIMRNVCAKKGAEAFATSFDCIAHKRNRSAKSIYNIMFTYTTASGKEKTRTERVYFGTFSGCKDLEQLPIKVYKNFATIDQERIPHN